MPGRIAAPAAIPDWAAVVNESLVRNVGELVVCRAASGQHGRSLTIARAIRDAFHDMGSSGRYCRALLLRAFLDKQATEVESIFKDRSLHS